MWVGRQVRAKTRPRYRSCELLLRQGTIMHSNGKKIEPRAVGSQRSSRRAFTRLLVSAGIASAVEPLLASGRAKASAGDTVFDYIVVGSGAGGGPVAARLANAGYTVAVIEAGVDATSAEASSVDPNTGIV